jgi:hypothetical protein
MGESDDGAVVARPLKVVDEREVLGQEGVGGDVEGVLEQDDGGELGCVDEIGYSGRRGRRSDAPGALHGAVAALGAEGLPARSAATCCR